MSDKSYDKLMDADKFIRNMLPVGMIDGTRLKIEFVSGFEKFNTRPYHNYETWGQGYRITLFGDDCKTIIATVEREDLDDALKEIKIIYNKLKLKT